MRLLVLMPDHLHAVLAVSRQQNLEKQVGQWKAHLARTVGLVWQKGFFEHRPRTEASLHETLLYMRQNPVRAGLTDRAVDWPFVWEPAR